MNTARNFEYVPSMVRDSFVDETSGGGGRLRCRGRPAIQHDAEAKHFDDLGDLITTFRSS